MAGDQGVTALAHVHAILVRLRARARLAGLQLDRCGRRWRRPHRSCARHGIKVGSTGGIGCAGRIGCEGACGLGAEGANDGSEK